MRERLGSLGSEKAVSLIALHLHNIPHVFAAATLAEADAAEPATLQGREDWRDRPLADHRPARRQGPRRRRAWPSPIADPANPGGFVVTVAIADVAAYVRPGSSLDREALERGNSVYFPDRVVPMLPERISNDLCSLREGEDRPALAVRMVIAADGAKRRHSFHRVMMRSPRQARLRAGAGRDRRARRTTRRSRCWSRSLRPLWAAYAALRDGARPARAAGPRPARAQDPARRRTARSTG